MNEADQNPSQEVITNQHSLGQDKNRLKSLAWLPIPVLFGTMILMRAVNPPFAYNSPSLMLALNFFISLMLSLFIIRIMIRPLLLRGSPGLLLLGCGVVFWGAAGVVGNAVARGDANTSVTIHNSCVWLSAICHLSGVVFWPRSKQTFRRAGLLLGVGCAAIVVAVISVVLMTRAGWMPIFFVQGQGGTTVRFFVLTSAIAMFALTAGILWSANRSAQTSFSYWYFLALLLISVGLLGVMIQPSVGSLVGWVGVTAQLLSSPYMLMAVLASRRESGAREIVLAEVISERRYRYGVAIAIVIAATALRLGFLSSLGTHAIYVTFYPAVMLAALHGGLMPGLLATGLSALIADYFWMEPVGKFSIGQPADLLAAGVFLMSCTIICIISERMRRAQTRAARAEEQAKHAIERARAQETLRQTEERFRLALKNAPVSVATQDRNLIYEWAYNQKTRRPDEIVGKTDADLFAPEDMPVILETKHRVLESGAEVHVQHWLTSNGKRLYLDLHYEPIRNSAGEITGVGVAAVDLTAQKLAEEALRESEEKFRLLFENMAEGVALHEMIRDDTGRAVDYRILAVNSAYVQQTGIPRDTANNALASELYTTSNPPYLAEYEEVVESGEPSFFETYFPPMEKHFSISVICTKPNQFATVFLDITKRKRAEENLRESRALLQAVLDSLPDAVFLKDAQSRIIMANPATLRIIGKSLDEVIGKDDSEHYADPEVGRVIMENDRRIMESGAAEVVEEIGLTPDGYRTFLSTKAPWRDTEGRVIGLLGITRDITDRKRMEDALRQSRDDLETRVAERTAELSQAYEKLQQETFERERMEEQLHHSQKMEAIGTLAGGIAHDFNNMLAAILGFTEMSLEDLPDRPEVQRNLQNVLRASMRARDLVKQILAFSRKTDHERKPLSLLPLIKETVQLLKASIPTTIEVRFIATATSDTVLAAPVEIQQILMNLATNASLAMQEKGGALEVSLTDIDFEPDSPVFGADVSPGEYVQLVVKDTGIGMGPDVMKRVFEPFFTTREVGKGTGMGLAVVYGIVKDLQGTVTVESEPGVGSTFRVFLPKVKTDTEVEGAQPVEIPGGNERILFVDDEEMLVEWGRTTLERLGYKVTAMIESQEALNAFSSDPSQFDLVITDHTMPGITGVQIAGEFLKLRPDIPIILCTGHSETVSPEIAKEAGIREYLMKPLARQELAEAARRVLDQEQESQ